MVFSNPQFGQIRTAGTKDDPMFCAVDVARALGYANPAKAVIDHCKGVTILETPTKGGVQPIKFIKEPEVYRLIFKSTAPNAEQFNSWLAEEVLPSIRRNGAYMTDATIESIIADPENGIRLLMALKDERRMRRLAEERAAYLEKVCMEQQPKAAVADTMPIEALASILRQNGVDTGKHRLYRWMRENGYLGTHGQGRNIPKRQYVEEGLFIVNTSTYPVGGEICSRTVALVTRKGMQFFMDKFIDNNQNEVKL